MGERGKPPPDPETKMQPAPPEARTDLVVTVTNDTRIAKVELMVLPERWHGQAVEEIVTKEIKELRPETSMHEILFSAATEISHWHDELRQLADVLAGEIDFSTEMKKEKHEARGQMFARPELPKTIEAAQRVIKEWRDGKIRVITNAIVLAIADLPATSAEWRPWSQWGSGAFKESPPEKTQGSLEHAGMHVKGLWLQRYHGPLAQILGSELMDALGGAVYRRVMSAAPTGEESTSLVLYQGKKINLLEIIQEALAHIATRSVEEEAEEAALDKLEKKRNRSRPSTIAALFQLDLEKIVVDQLQERFQSCKALAGAVNKPDDPLNTLDIDSRGGLRSLKDKDQKERLQDSVTETREVLMLYLAPVMEMMADIKVKRYAYLTEELEKARQITHHLSDPIEASLKNLAEGAYGKPRWVREHLIDAPTPLAAQVLFQALKKMAECEFAIREDKGKSAQAIADDEVAGFFYECKTKDVVQAVIELMKADGLEKWPESVRQTNISHNAGLKL